MKKTLFVIACMLNTLWASAQFSGSGDGTESSPYLIYNENQLAQLANFLNQEGVVFKLQKDLDISGYIAENNPSQGWAPIGVESSPFKGVFYGNGHTISGLMINRPNYDNIGLFGYVYGAQINNLTIKASNVTGHHYVSVLCGTSYGDCSFTNCDVEITGKLSGLCDIGGIVGYMREGSTISDCDVTGNMESKAGSIFEYGTIGGIGGTVESCYITDCTYNGSIVAKVRLAGGLIGSIHGCSLNNCTVKANIKGENTIGGISGVAESFNNIFINCHHKGTINNDGDYTGGILGLSKGGCIAEMESCSHFGDITGINFVGGVVGAVLNQNDQPYSECSYCGKNEITNGNTSYPKMSNCLSIANISGMDWVGGLIGTDETANSYRSEDVSHPHYNGPQVHYYHWNKYYKDIVSTDITNSYYSGSISGNDNVGGLVGLKDAGYITNCYSYAKIVGRNNVGGIAGTATGTSVSNSTFTLTIKSNVATNPNISASSSNVGRIYGSRGENVVIGALGSQESNRALTQTSVMLCGVAQDIVDDEQNGTSVGPSMLKLKANYVSWGWNFDENWNILETECYPYKKYQAAPPVIESSLVSHATEIHGKSLDGGTVYMYYKDREPVSTQCIGNQWSFTTEELQSGAQVQLYADVDNITPSYFTSATVKYPGSGTETDPYRIYSAEDLQGASNSGYYRIMNDIDLTNWIRENSPTTGWQPIGRNSTAATYIDGDNHKITGLWINTTDDYNGLFSNYSAGYIKNLKVEVAKDKYVRGGNYTGILIGRMYNGQIINCEVLGNAEGTEKIGGVVGYTENSTLKEVFYQGVVSTSFAGANIGGLAGHTKNVILDYCGTEAIVNATGNVSNVGGLVGHADGGTFTQALSELEIVSTGSESNVGGLIGKSNVVLSNCASFGIVSASGDNSYTGGLVGISTNSITNCYSTASTSGTLYTAGLVGYSYGSIDKCYAQGDVTGVMYGAGVVGELDGTSASLSNSVALNNIISLTAQSSWGCRVVGGFKNGCNEPDMNNYALNTMQVSLNNVPQRKTDDNIEGIAKTETELMSSEFYMNLGWDMGNTWLIQEGREYPYLNISKGDDVVLATGITLSNSSITIKPGETATLLASVMPNGTTQKSVTWSSSNQYVATVENGIVTALTTGTTTINATTTDGTNLSASCVVTVSSNASDEPTSLEPSTDISVYPNVLYFNDVEQRAGDFNLELNMKCAQENITAFQCDVYLPEGVSWKTTTDKRGNVSYILPIFNEERTDASYHTISPIAINADGSYSIIVYSMDLESILGTDGALMTLPLEISEDMEATDYNLIIRNIVMTDINQKEKNVAKVVSRLTIPKYELGDANGDGNINITDIVAVIAYIRGNASPDFVYDAADISCDGVINITDIVGIISIIRSGVSSAKPMNTMQEGRLLATRSDSKLIADSFSVEEGTLKANAHLCMNNADEEFTAFQCDVVFPEGISWASSIDALGNKKYEQPVFNTESNRTDASYHTADAGMNADGSMNVMVYSMSQDVFFGESGAILDMPFAFDEDLAPGVYNITLKNIVMTRPDQSQTKPEDYTFTVIVGGDVNGIDAVSTNSIQAENENIYDLQGRKIQSVKKGIYIENGKKVIIK